MNGNHTAQGLKDVMRGMMSAIHYFDIFSHPLHKDELQKLIHKVTANTADYHAALNYLVQHRLLFEHNGYYLPHNRYENINRRQQGERMADKLWPEAVKKSKLISRFPFVEAVFVSGSMSKGFMDEYSDIDFLIITRPGRLWVSRTLLTIYKKIFLLNSHRFFCVNYFLDTNNMVLRDKNLFVATELLFCRPVVNHSKFHELLEMNKWANTFYPSLKVPVHGNERDYASKNNRRGVLEMLLSGWVGNLIENWCMQITKKFWDVKFKNMNREQYARDMKNTHGVSKHHPNGFRDRILHEHEQRMIEYDKKFYKASHEMAHAEMQIHFR